MSNKIVYQGQSFLDKVIEHTGSIENAFASALLNSTSVTDDVVIGMDLTMSAVTKKAVVGLFNENNRPATGMSLSQIEEIENIGIGSMIIGNNFIVS
jgi:hypothetical protein